MFVAKSYKNLTRLSEPFEKNKKMYITIQLKSGLSKEVRAYTAEEYFKMYPEEKPTRIDGKPSKAKPWDKYYKSQKETLGFSPDNWIWVFFGVTEENEWWFSSSLCRNHVVMGWYLPFNETVPADLPEGVQAVKFSAEGLFDEEDWFIDNAETAIKQRLKELKSKC